MRDVSVLAAAEGAGFRVLAARWRERASREAPKRQTTASPAHCWHVAAASPRGPTQSERACSLGCLGQPNNDVFPRDRRRRHELHDAASTASGRPRGNQRWQGCSHRGGDLLRGSYCVGPRHAQSSSARLPVSDPDSPPRSGILQSPAKSLYQLSRFLSPADTPAKYRRSLIPPPSRVHDGLFST